MSIDDKGSIESSLFEKRKKLYPREVHGLFANLRLLGVTVLLGLYYLIPWINFDGRQIVLFDLPERKFYIFNWIFWPQDFIYLALLLVCAAFALFLFTALAGRLWCGYACPQTVWTEVFLWIERKVEGTRSQQMKLDKQTNNVTKFRIKATKHTLWIIFSLYTGFTFVGFFTPIRELGQSIMSFNLGPWETFWFFFYSLATYGNAGWLREQVCMYMCPYARFQSAMLDKNTLVISYDALRGEPRGGRKKGDDYKAKQLGSCIDCSLCVQVCPTGIDIRDGLQYECIGCAACIDVCDSVMDKMEYPRGLVKYTTENSLQGKPTSILRPRIIIYTLLLISIMSGVIYSIETRDSVELNILRDRNALYRENFEGIISNSYTIKVLNMDLIDHKYHLTVSGIDGIKSSLTAPISVKSGEVIEMPLQLSVDPGNLKKASTPITISLQSENDTEAFTSSEGRFIGPLDP
ncbi:MAG: cytochrome c oxidase accessory protein CcoG [Cycloclasticus sp.]|nr:cytochrome c oxidase accessory protein CcoG [Cycloclasticus sp.]MBG96451.1 cytochrome c oxidase accessory protein CcoG [Cycloclasticus sp.]HAI96578.1 cytochrome c oxidase accessory protein CcoG [Methylococcaceae bacterium]